MSKVDRAIVLALTCLLGSSSVVPANTSNTLTSTPHDFPFWQKDGIELDNNLCGGYLQNKAFDRFQVSEVEQSVASLTAETLEGTKAGMVYGEFHDLPPIDAIKQTIEENPSIKTVFLEAVEQTAQPILDAYAEHKDYQRFLTDVKNNEEKFIDRQSNYELIQYLTENNIRVVGIDDTRELETLSDYNEFNEGREEKWIKAIEPEIADLAPEEDWLAVVGAQHTRKYDISLQDYETKEFICSRGGIEEKIARLGVPVKSVDFWSNRIKVTDPEDAPFAVEVYGADYAVNVAEQGTIYTTHHDGR